jgi:parallel beta-helix repeat protein
MPNYYRSWDFNGLEPGLPNVGAALQLAVNAVCATGGTLVLEAGIYNLGEVNVKIPGTSRHVRIEAYGAILECSEHATNLDGVYMGATGTSSPEDIWIHGLTVRNYGRMGIQVYTAYSATSPPQRGSGIYFRDTKCIGRATSVAGIYINSAKNIRIEGHETLRGARGICTQAPGGTLSPSGAPPGMNRPYDVENVIVRDCKVTETTQFGIQFFYGRDLVAEGNYVDCSLMTGGDKSGITVDRAERVTVSGNRILNAPENGIFLAGSKDVTITGNVVSGGKRGIQAYFNNESDEDPGRKQCERITVVANTVVSVSGTAIIYNGVTDGTIAGNTAAFASGVPTTNHAIRLEATDVRSGDNTPMPTTGIVIVGNSVANGSVGAISSNPAQLIGNKALMTDAAGPTDLVVTLDNVQLGNAVGLGTFASQGDAAAVGALTVKDGSGITRKLAVIP